MPRPRSLTAIVSFVRGRGLKPWLVQYRAIDAKTGQRRRFREFFAREAEALSRTSRINAHVAIETAAVAPVPTATLTAGAVTFRQHYAEWLHDIVSRRKPGSQVMYESNMRVHVLPRLGDVLVTPATLTAREITRVITACADAGVTWGMQKNILRTIGACLRWAVKWKRLETNVAHGLFVDLRDDSYEEPEPNPLTRAQIFAFLHWIRTNGRELPPGYRPRQPDAVLAVRPRGKAGFDPHIAHWYPYFLLLFSTGMRRNEAIALQWNEVRLEEGQTPRIRVVASFCPFARRKAQEGHRRYKVSGLQKPKSKAGSREITGLLPELVAVLRALQRTRRADAFAKGCPPPPYVFLGVRGRRVLGRKTIDAIFAQGMAAIGATDEHHTVHDLRDTCATLHLMAKPGDLLRLARQLGHATPVVTMTRYAKWIPQDEGSLEYATVLQRPDYGQPAPVPEMGGESPSAPTVVPLRPGVLATIGHKAGVLATNETAVLPQTIDE